MQNGVLFSSIHPLAQNSLGIEFCNKFFSIYAGYIWLPVIIKVIETISFITCYMYYLPFIVLIFSLPTDTVFPEDFDDLRVP